MDRQKIAVTGANGHLGLQLIGRIRALQPDAGIVALVRSKKAADRVREHFPGSDDAGVSVEIVDYRDAASIRSAADGCEVLVHLVGIIKESKSNTFEQAHEDVSRAIVASGISAGQIITLGILGTSESASNACFRSRYAAERILLDGPVPATIIRVPMVLGPDDYASFALARSGGSRFVFSFRPSSLEQPIDSEDVVSAIVACLDLDPGDRVIELAGPESLSRSALIRRAGSVLGRQPVVIPLPVVFGYLMAGLFEIMMASPPVTRAMLGVLDHDDQIDPGPACELLGLRLRPLDETLERLLPTLVR